MFGISIFTKLFARPAMYPGRDLSALSLKITREKRAKRICAECDKCVSFTEGVNEDGMTEMCHVCGAVHGLDAEGKPIKLIGFERERHANYRKKQNEETRWIASVNLEKQARRWAA